MLTRDEVKRISFQQLSPIFGEKEASLLAQILALDLGFHWEEKMLPECIEESVLNDAIQRLQTGEPIQYVTESAWFYGLRIKVNSSVLIPRPETEELVEKSLNYIQHLQLPNPVICDIGTGSGIIPIKIKKTIPDSIVYGVDISSEALQVAKFNASFHQTDIQFFQCDITDTINSIQLLPDNIHILISNPPYILPEEITSMDRKVVDYEPKIALFIKEHQPPEYFYNKIIQAVLPKLHPNAVLIFETSYQYAAKVKQCCIEYGFLNTSIFQDLEGKDRIVVAQK